VEPGFAFILETIGTPELLLIGVVALIFLGPRQLPVIARKIGRAMAEFRAAASEFRETWEREVDFEQEAKAMREEFLGASKDFQTDDNRTIGKPIAVEKKQIAAAENGEENDFEADNQSQALRESAVPEDRTAAFEPGDERKFYDERKEIEPPSIKTTAGKSINQTEFKTNEEGITSEEIPEKSHSPKAEDTFPTEESSGELSPELDKRNWL
jgi:Tat protein translocase TatB subunit